MHEIKQWNYHILGCPNNQIFEGTTNISKKGTQEDCQTRTTSNEHSTNSTHPDDIDKSKEAPYLLGKTFFVDELFNFNSNLLYLLHGDIITIS